MVRFEHIPFASEPGAGGRLRGRGHWICTVVYLYGVGVVVVGLDVRALPPPPPPDSFGERARTGKEVRSVAQPRFYVDLGR